MLVWQTRLPGWLTTGVGRLDRDTELRDILRNHVTTVVEHFKGRIWQWDVVNEAVSDPWDSPPTLHYKGFWAEHLGPDYVADAFRWARAADPKALLFYNDYNIEAFGSGDPANDKTQFVYDMAKGLLRAACHRRGRQPGPPGHPVRQLRHPRSRRAEEVRRAGLATAFTEVDVRSQLTEAVQAGDSNEINPRLQASAANCSVLLQACLADRHCLSFTVWGSDDGHSWTNTWDFGSGVGREAMAAVYDASYQPKPAYRALQSDLSQVVTTPRIPQRPSR